MATTAPPVAFGIPAEAIVREIEKLAISHVIVVPDSFQRTLITRLKETESLSVLTVCTEDEGVGVNAGLYVGGRNPMMVIQNNGVFASINTLKAIALDAKVPTLMLVGQFLRDLTKPIEEQHARAVRMLEPTLATWGVPFFRLEGPDDIGVIAQAYHRAHEEQGPTVVIIGAPTS